MQDNFRTSSHFSQRAEKLAEALGCQAGELPDRMGISRRMFFGYKSGKYPITAKAWRKLDDS
jgi:hypothetical protein